MRHGVLVLLALALLFACHRPRGGADGDRNAAMRIVSVGGAVTEIVFALGEGANVVAIDTSSTYPETVTKLPKVGYQRTLGADAILTMTPSVVLATEDAGPPAALEQLRAAGVRVVVATADPSVAGARARITAIARALDRDPLPLLQALDRDLTEARSVVEKSAGRPRALVVYSRGDKTLHVLGRNTAGQAMLDLAGADNVAAGIDGTKPVAPEALAAAAPDVIVVPSRALDTIGGVDGLLATPGLAETPAARRRHVVAMDDLLLLGFGPRTGHGARELAARLHGLEARP